MCQRNFFQVQGFGKTVRASDLDESLLVPQRLQPQSFPKSLFVKRIAKRQTIN